MTLKSILTFIKLGLVISIGIPTFAVLGLVVFLLLTRLASWVFDSYLF